MRRWSTRGGHCDRAEIRNRSSAGVHGRRWIFLRHFERGRDPRQVALLSFASTTLFTVKACHGHDPATARLPLTPAEMPSRTAQKIAQGAAPHHPESPPTRPLLLADTAPGADPRDEDTMTGLGNQAVGFGGKRNQDMMMMMMIGIGGTTGGWRGGTENKRGKGRGRDRLIVGMAGGGRGIVRWRRSLGRGGMWRINLGRRLMGRRRMEEINRPTSPGKKRNPRLHKRRESR